MINLEVAKVGQLPDVTIKLDDAEFFELRSRVFSFIDEIQKRREKTNSGKGLVALQQLYISLSQKFEDALAPFIARPPLR